MFKGKMVLLLLLLLLLLPHRPSDAGGNFMSLLWARRRLAKSTLPPLVLEGEIVSVLL